MKRSSLTSKIPPTLRQELSDDPFMQTCCLSRLGGCVGRVEWHHAFTYGGKRQNQRFCILPVCSLHHQKEGQFKRHLEWLMLSRATHDELELYPRVDWERMRQLCKPLK